MTSDNHPEPETPAAEMSEEQMRERAKQLVGEIDELAKEIAELSDQKALANKELRSLTNKLTTITLRRM